MGEGGLLPSKLKKVEREKRERERKMPLEPPLYPQAGACSDVLVLSPLLFRLLSLLPSLRKRPFFALVAVDAPFGLRLKRLAMKEGERFSLEKMIQLEDQVRRERKRPQIARKKEGERKKERGRRRRRKEA